MQPENTLSGLTPETIILDDPMAAEAEGSTIERETPDPDPARASLVSSWCGRVREARDYWHKGAFKRMIADMRFAAGNQWQDQPTAADQAQFNEDKADRYVANITLRHIAARTASIYGKNPKVVARRKERLLSTVWDGSAQTLQTALQSAQMGDPMALAILQDAQQTMQQNQMLDRMSKTLELLFDYEIDEQPLPFKVQMKATVRRALTTCVGYVKLGFERVMARQPDVDRRIEATEQRLATLERLSADLADGEIDDSQAEAEELRVILTQLQKSEQTIVREGLTLNYPDSTAIIPDPEVKQLRGFVGAGWVAEEYFLTSNRIKEIYQVDVSANAPGASETDDGRKVRDYHRTDRGEYRPTEHDNKGQTYHCVWEIYDRATGMVYVVCEGYGDFLQEPAEPETYLERFFPWFPFVVNEVYDDEAVYPPSDVRLMRDMQKELNRSRQGLREHRVASRPKTFTRSGLLNPDEKDSITTAKAHEVIELQGLQPNEKIQDVLQSHSGSNIDAALYDPSPAFEDYLRTTGNQEANLGGTSGATATEASIAEGSRSTATSSVVDDLDEFLTEFARAAGQVLLLNFSREQVQAIVGPGAVWPDLDRESVAREIHLEVEAASTGRPNKAQEIQNAQAVFPMLMQIPGMSPEWMGREMLRRMDDRLDITDAFAAGMPSIQMLNRAQQALAPQAAGQGDDPNAQGAEGADNAPGTDPAQVNSAPRPPEGPPQI